MYTLYALPGTCSLGIHVLLNKLDQPFEWVNAKEVENYTDINPAGIVPVLKDGSTTILEGGAIVLYLLEKHDSKMLPNSLGEKSEFLQKLFFNYATLHPAYSKLFFAKKKLEGEAQQQAFAKASEGVASLWKIVDNRLSKTPFAGGDEPTILDYLLCVYANWNAFLDADIELGSNVKRMIRQVIELPEFKQALEKEGVNYMSLN